MPGEKDDKRVVVARDRDVLRDAIHPLLRAAVVLCVIGLIGLGVALYVSYRVQLASAGGAVTPEISRTRGTVVSLDHVGPFSVERRRYDLSDSSNRGAKFCDYWIAYEGMSLALDQLGYENYYADCEALVLLPSEVPAFIIGISSGSGNGLSPWLITLRDGQPAFLLLSEATYDFQEPLARAPRENEWLILGESRIHTRTLETMGLPRQPLLGPESPHSMLNYAINGDRPSRR